MTSELETNIVAVERIKEYIETPSEVRYSYVMTFTPNKLPCLGLAQERFISQFPISRMWSL